MVTIRRVVVEHHQSTQRYSAIIEVVADLLGSRMVSVVKLIKAGQKVKLLRIVLYPKETTEAIVVARISRLLEFEDLLQSWHPKVKGQLCLTPRKLPYPRLQYFLVKRVLAIEG